MHSACGTASRDAQSGTVRKNGMTRPSVTYGIFYLRFRSFLNSSSNSPCADHTTSEKYTAALRLIAVFRENLPLECQDARSINKSISGEGAGSWSSAEHNMLTMKAPGCVPFTLLRERNASLQLLCLLKVRKWAIQRDL